MCTIFSRFISKPKSKETLALLLRKNMRTWLAAAIGQSSHRQSRFSAVFVVCTWQKGARGANGKSGGTWILCRQCGHTVGRPYGAYHFDWVQAHLVTSLPSREGERQTDSVASGQPDVICRTSRCCLRPAQMVPMFRDFTQWIVLPRQRALVSSVDSTTLQHTEITYSPTSVASWSATLGEIYCGTIMCSINFKLPLKH